MLSSKSIFFVFTALLLNLLLLVQSTPLENDKEAEEVKVKINVPAVPLYRYFRKEGTDHMLTTDWDELGHGKDGYKFEKSVGLCYTSKVDDTVALLRYYNPKVVDHMYTTDKHELGPHGSKGYVSEGITCWCYPTQVSGTIPLYRYYKESLDHVYSTDKHEFGGGKHGYVSEGITCYVFPPTPPTP